MEGVEKMKLTQEHKYSILKIAMRVLITCGLCVIMYVVAGWQITKMSLACWVAVSVIFGLILDR